MGVIRPSVVHVLCMWMARRLHHVGSASEWAEVTTIEGLANGELHPMQTAFKENHGLQCGFTPGMIMAGDMVNRLGKDLDEAVRQSLRAISVATGYHNIVKAIQDTSKM